jgi:hypothetical protein
MQNKPPRSPHNILPSNHTNTNTNPTTILSLP